MAVAAYDAITQVQIYIDALLQCRNSISESRKIAEIDDLIVRLSNAKNMLQPPQMNVAAFYEQKRQTDEMAKFRATIDTNPSLNVRQEALAQGINPVVAAQTVAQDVSRAQAVEAQAYTNQLWNTNNNRWMQARATNVPVETIRKDVQDAVKNAANISSSLKPAVENALLSKLGV